jgi:hypothetical protein
MLADYPATPVIKTDSETKPNQKLLFYIPVYKSTNTLVNYDKNNVRTTSSESEHSGK